ncbi:MAG: toll/interleukin-1 receptor domain-containing protein [Planctomycetes bacterium]|nr:toll/interleukin-1 receptor domain-containing protein [Planctomycetota bacterium]
MSREDALALQKTADKLRRNGQHAQAIRYYEMSQAEWVADHDGFGVAFCQFGMGLCTKVEQPTKAAIHFCNALAFFESIPATHTRYNDVVQPIRDLGEYLQETQHSKPDGGLTAFMSYVREDQDAVRLIRHELERRGIGVWQYVDRLLPGQWWKDEIRKAIRQGDFFIVCFSANYWARRRTYVNEELTVAVEELRLRSRQITWFIPILLSRCEVPDIPIGAGQTLHDLQLLDLSDDWERGIALLTQVVYGNE